MGKVGPYHRTFYGKVPDDQRKNVGVANDDFDFIRSESKELGISMREFIRRLVNLYKDVQLTRVD